MSAITLSSKNVWLKDALSVTACSALAQSFSPLYRGVLMCFDEKNGRLLWQLVVPKHEEDPYFDWPKCGIS